MNLTTAIDCVVHDQCDGFVKHQARLRLIELHEEGKVSRARLAELLDVSLFDLDDEIEEIRAT